MQNLKNRLNNTIQAAFISLFITFISGCNQPTSPSRGLTETQVEAYQVINQAINIEDVFIRVKAIEIAATTGQINFMPSISRLLMDPYVPVRYTAALAVGDMQYKPAINTINQLLKDNDPNVLLAASYAMVKLGYPAYIEVLRDSVKNNRSPIIKANSALLLAKLGDTNSIPLIRQLIIDSPTSSIPIPQNMIEIEYQAAEALAMLGDPTITERIWPLLFNQYTDIRFIGIRAMGFLGTSQAETALLNLLDDPEIIVRLAVAEQLGKFNNKSGESVVLNVLRKSRVSNIERQTQEAIYIQTALAIGEIGTQRLTIFLPELIKNESIFVRLAAAKAVFRSLNRI